MSNVIWGIVVALRGKRAAASRQKKSEESDPYENGQPRRHSHALVEALREGYGARPRRRAAGGRSRRRRRHVGAVNHRRRWEGNEQRERERSRQSTVWKTADPNGRPRRQQNRRSVTEKNRAFPFSNCCRVERKSEQNKRRSPTSILQIAASKQRRLLFPHSDCKEQTNARCTIDSNLKIFYHFVF